jgi:FSR family fosmidomycin resistance protein-like MFS transporter
MRRGTALALTLLAIEFFDEFVFGVREAAWPLIRDDLGMTYAQIGILLAVPSLFSSVVEPFLGILGDVWRRRALILGGGAAFALALILTALSQEFGLLLLSFTLMYPASGAFVSLSQATLMDQEPTRHEQNMARWNLAGSVGVVTGPLALAAIAGIGRGWRGLYVALAGIALALMGIAWRTLDRPGVEPQHLDPSADRAPLGPALWQGWLAALRSLRRRDVLRWLALLQFGDLAGDILLGFLALYFVDVVGATPARAGMAVAVWTGAGLVGDLVAVPLLERVRGLRVVWLGAAAQLLLFPVFLLVQGFGAKLVLLAALGLLSLGWYPVLQAQLYSAMPGQSGTVMTLGNLAGLVGSLIPLGLGLVAQRTSLGVTMWLLLLGPAALLVGVPRRGAGATGQQQMTGEQP